MRPIAAVLAVFLMCSVPHSATAATDALRAQLLAARTRAASAIARFGPRYGDIKAIGIDERLTSDLAALAPDARPAGYSPADWDETLAALVALDADVAAQLDGEGRGFELRPGLHAMLYRSGVDGVLDVVCTYVPPHPAPNARVAFLIHGNGQTENEFLAQPYLRRLADETGTILIAPYGRGNYDFVGAPTADFYGLIGLVRGLSAYGHADFLLVGYSMGGFTTFMIGPSAPVRWKAVMSISGSIVGSVARRVVAAWKYTPIYVVFGSADTNIPTAFGRDTAVFLFQSGLPVSYYEEAGGDHRIRSFVPTLREAWLDMHAGTIRDGGVGRLARDRVPQLPKNGGISAGRPD